jgi:hypothetical protein
MVAVRKKQKTDWEKAIDRIAKEKEPVVEFMNVELSQEGAKKLLQGNENNRHLNKSLINKYRRLMNIGRWVLNGETIKVGQVDGLFVLLDGQHRLNAIASADKPVNVSLALGLSPDHFKTIDTGRARSAGDILKMAGYKNVHVLSAAVRWLLTYERDEYLRWTSELCPEDILEGLKRWPRMQDLVVNAEHMRHVLQPSIGAFFIYVTQHIDPEKCFDFFNKVEHGEGLSKKDPILAFRTIMIKYRSQQVLLDKRYALAYLINTWNAYYNEVTIGSIRWRSGQPFPEIDGVNRETLFFKNSI